MKSKDLISFLWIASTVFILAILVIYIFNFGSIGFSKDHERWAQFADFFGGLLNPFFTLLNLVILTYLSIRLVHKEDERNTWTLQELVRPYANIEHENQKNSIRISVHNCGLGPMIITKLLFILSNGKTFNNFDEAMSYIIELNEWDGDDVGFKIDYFGLNSDSCAIGKDKSHDLVRLYSNEKKNEKELVRFLNFIRIHINGMTVKIDYQDMYKRPIDKLSEKLYSEEWE